MRIEKSGLSRVNFVGSEPISDSKLLKFAEAILPLGFDMILDFLRRLFNFKLPKSEIKSSNYANEFVC